jgi:hypothetical protein
VQVAASVKYYWFGSSNETGSISDGCGQGSNILQLYDIGRSVPPQFCGKALVLYKVKSAYVSFLSQDRRTEKVLHKRSVGCRSMLVTESNDRGSHFTETELLHGCSEGIIGVKRLRLDLAEDLGIGQHGCCDGGLGEVNLRCVEDRLVEDMVVSEIGITTTIR